MEDSTICGRTLEDFTKIDKIGEGTYGIVYKCLDKRSGKLVAMKKIRLESSNNEGIPRTALRECSMLRQLRHADIVRLEEVIMQEDRLYLIFEHLQMDLERFMDDLPGEGGMEKPMLKCFLYQICQGMCYYCHQRGVLHRDLKPENLLVEPDKQTVKLDDFGLARAIDIPIRTYTHEVVTLRYRAPEVLLGARRYSTGVDIWSIGCIFAQMARKRPLFRGDSQIDQLFRIFRLLSTPNEHIWPGVSLLSGYQPTFPKWHDNRLEAKMGAHLDRDGLDLLTRMLRYNPVERISAKAMLKHEFFNDMDRSTLPDPNFDGTLVLTDQQ